MTTDMTIVEGTVGNVIPVALRNALTLCGALIMMIFVSPHFTGLVLVLIPILLAPLLLIGRRMQRLSVRAQDRFAEAVGYAGEGLEALETVQAFGQEDAVSARFDTAIESAFAASRAQIRVSGLMSSLMISLIFAGMLVLLYQCAIAVVIDHSMSPGALLQLLVLALVAANALKDLSGSLEPDPEGFRRGSTRRRDDRHQADHRGACPARRAAFTGPRRGHFRSGAVCVPGAARPAGPERLLPARPRGRAPWPLVGPSGPGKSTVFRLLLRFYDPDFGAVRIDGVDLAHSADPRQARERLGSPWWPRTLPCSPARRRTTSPLVASTRRPRRSGRPEPGGPGREGFLDALPEGFDTMIGERAKTLSGGQRQRIAIARALVRRSPILLLDEATSALDAENERLVQHALQGAMAGRTTLVIAHRLATVLEADRIVVMDAGRVVEEGRHGELLATAA